MSAPVTLRPAVSENKAGTVRNTNRAAAALTALAGQLPSIDLDELNAAAQLQTRVDTKYLLTPEQLVAVLNKIGNHLRVLEIDGQRGFGYESVYFDTPALKTFHDHRQRRRKRFKVRTRLYENSGDCMLEVKVKTGRGATVKRRTSYPAGERHRLTATGREFVASVLRAEYGARTPELVAALVGRYRRTTFVDLTDGARMTCDTNLSWADRIDNASGPDAVLVETKSRAGAARIDLALRAAGIRPVKISKYAIGTALLHPHLPANPWNRLLRQEFDWRRDTVPLPPLPEAAHPRGVS